MRETFEQWTGKAVKDLDERVRDLETIVFNQQQVNKDLRQELANLWDFLRGEPKTMSPQELEKAMIEMSKNDLVNGFVNDSSSDGLNTYHSFIKRSVDLD